MAYLLETCLAVGSMLVFGSLNTILLKLQMTLSATGVDGKSKDFEKPWFITLLMFSSMVMALPLVAYKKCKERSQSSLKDSLLDESDAVQGAAAETSTLSYGAKVRLVSMPAIFDLAGIGIALIGLVLLPSSIWQIMRGAEVIFAEIISVLMLNQKSYAYKWLSVVVVVVGIAIVGVGSVLSGSADDDDDGKQKSSNLVILGIGLVLFSQIVQAGQMVGEEYLMKEVDLEAIEVIGYEGMWGLLAMVVVVLPVVYFIPGEDSGSQENTIDSFVMLQSSSELFLTFLLLWSSCLIYNLSGIMITSYLSAVHRVIIEAMRTLVVWFCAIITKYYIDDKLEFGEALTSYSWLEASGFALVFVGQLLYGALIKVPGLTYPREDKQAPATPFKSPSAMKSPLYRLGPDMVQHEQEVSMQIVSCYD
mmetsp:Transcript_159042/g.305060  ORF Transcript_159042/g.305060 Transcript_159042/m.305060 type:complete len:420 (+) Transcript_159042:64-1323(+)